MACLASGVMRDSSLPLVAQSNILPVTQCDERSEAKYPKGIIMKNLLLLFRSDVDGISAGLNDRDSKQVLVTPKITGILRPSASE